MRRVALAGALVASVWASLANAWEEPARGSTTRAQLMEAIRPHAEWRLGSPVEFVIHDLRQSGALAFASVHAQRPGGGAIDPTRTPGYLRGEIALDGSDWASLQALYVRSGSTWVAVHWVMGAGDVWWAWGPLCAVWRPVIAEVCEGL